MKYIAFFLLFIFTSSFDLYIPVAFAEQKVYVYKESGGSFLFSGQILHRKGYKLIKIKIYPSLSNQTEHHSSNCNLSTQSSESNNLKGYKKLISRLADSYQLDPLLIRSIISVESCFNPYAKSDKGALGLMQIMPAVRHIQNPNELYNPQMNLQIGISYFKSLMNRFANNTILALAAYNAGSNAVQKYHGIPPYSQTKRYIKKVMVHYHALVANNQKH